MMRHIVSGFCMLIAAAPVLAQRSSEVVIEHEKIAWEKTPILVTMFDVLSGGMPAVGTADLLQEVVANDLRLSGLFVPATRDVEGDTLTYQYAIEGSVEGALRDAAQTGEDAPTTVSLNLVTWPERQLLLNKRYRPVPNQVRTSAHHFANEVITMLTGEPGICLTRIVFSRGTGDRRDLWVVDFDGEGLMRLTANRTLNLCPAWSPDGTRIAFTSYRNGQQGLYSLDTSNGKVRLIIERAGLNLGADWHPSGQELAVSLSSSGDPEIYRIRPDGGVIKRLTVSPAIEISPSWSPGGRDLVFTSDRTGTPQLYIIDADGAGRRRLTYEGRYNDSAVWSPDGDRVAYATREGNYTQIVVVKATGESRRILTDGTWGNSEDPSWAPDGRHLVFASDRSGEFKLYVCDVVEETFRPLTTGSDPDITPAWSR
jgi:TolB protein